MPKRTKIVATISSANCDIPLLKNLYSAGMDVARLNTAHMTTEDAIKTIKNIRAVSNKIAIMIDTKGPEVRTAVLPQNLELTTGDEVKFSGDSPMEGVVPVNFVNFAKYVKAGHRIMIDDGELELLVVSSVDGIVTATAMNDGKICSRKSVNVPDVPLPLPALSQRDREFISFAIEQDLDFIAHSFVRSRDDIMAVRSILETAGSQMGIIAKIENHQGVEQLEEIVKSADGIMVARGDLGVELPLEEVPRIQKRMIYLCMKYHKPVITATQMLQSMITNPRPTRAEVSDVANAVFDGSDAVMLSGETSMGKYPVESVRMMARIAREVEDLGNEFFTNVDQVDVSEDPVRGKVVRSAVVSPKSLPIKAIVGLTESGESARLASAYRSDLPLYFSSPNPTVVRQLSLSYGVYAYFHSYEDRQTVAFEPLLKSLLKEDKVGLQDLVACLGSFPTDKGSTNFCCYNTIDELLAER